MVPDTFRDDVARGIDGATAADRPDPKPMSKVAAIQFPARIPSASEPHATKAGTVNQRAPKNASPIITRAMTTHARKSSPT